MNPPLLPPGPVPGANPAGIISPVGYDQYAASWLGAAGGPAGAVLAQRFMLSKKGALVQNFGLLLGTEAGKMNEEMAGWSMGQPCPPFC